MYVRLDHGRPLEAIARILEQVGEIRTQPQGWGDDSRLDPIPTPDGWAPPPTPIALIDFMGGYSELMRVGRGADFARHTLPTQPVYLDPLPEGVLLSALVVEAISDACAGVTRDSLVLDRLQSVVHHLSIAHLDPGEYRSASLEDLVLDRSAQISAVHHLPRQWSEALDLCLARTRKSLILVPIVWPIDDSAPLSRDGISMLDHSDLRFLRHPRLVFVAVRDA